MKSFVFFAAIVAGLTTLASNAVKDAPETLCDKPAITTASGKTTTSCPYSKGIDDYEAAKAKAVASTKGEEAKSCCPMESKATAMAKQASKSAEDCADKCEKATTVKAKKDDCCEKETGTIIAQAN